MADDMVPPGNSDIPTHRLKAGCSASELRGPMPAQKRCGTCRQSKPLSEFNRKSSRADGRQEVCRECNRASSRRYYERNRAHHIAVVRRRTDAQRDVNFSFVARHLTSHPCADCGNDDIRVLDFDHLPGTHKRDNVMQLVRDGFRLAVIEDEIAKCEVRCRNCHAIVTYERLGRTWRTDFARGAR